MPTEVAEEEWVEPDLPMEVVHELMEMGIPENQAKHSVFNAGVNSGSEAAISWFYENIENPSLGTLRNYYKLLRITRNSKFLRIPRNS